jgi:AcrR family transcriptional regulator
MQSSRETVDLIVDGAMRALARHGTERVSMTDICRESQVSRGTLYRYFSNRDEVLEAVNQRISGANRDFLEKAIAEDPRLEVRVPVVLKVMIGFPTHFPHMRAIFEHEPKTALGFLGREMPNVLKVLDEYLRPALEKSPPVVEGRLTVEDLLELFYRLVTSSFLIPTPGSDTLDQRIAALWESLTARPEPVRETRTPRPRRAVSSRG